MNGAISYISLFAILLVVALLIWSLVLTYQDKKSRKLSAGKKLSQLRKKIDSLPEKTDEEKSKKDALYKELSFEYFENILGAIESMKTSSDKKPKKSKKPEKKPRKSKKSGKK